MLKHFTVPAIFLAVGATVCLFFASLEPATQDRVAYESPQAAIAASFK
jgi:hypothetical protein